MKKILFALFAAAVLMVSCSKDSDSSSSSAPDPQPASLTGTLWEATVSYSNVPVVGSGMFKPELFFKEGDLCHVEFNLPATLQSFLSMAGINSFDSGEYSYTFDGETVVVAATTPMELAYTGTTLVYDLPAQYASTLATYLGTTQIVFYKK